MLHIDVPTVQSNAIITQSHACEYKLAQCLDV